MQIFYCDYCGRAISGYNTHVNTRDKKDICGSCKTEYYNELNQITAERDAEFELARKKYHSKSSALETKWKSRLEKQSRKE